MIFSQTPAIQGEEVRPSLAVAGIDQQESLHEGGEQISINLSEDLCWA